MKTRLLLSSCAFALISILPLSAAKYYLYTGSDPWGTRGDGTKVSVTAGTLHSTLNGYAASDEIWIAQGTYTTTTSPATIALKEGMTVYGGFFGNETSISQRQLADETNGNGVAEPWEMKYPTIINGTGSAGTPATYVMFNSATSYTLDGITIDTHYPTQTTTAHNGGAINCTGTAPIISKCIFRNINKTSSFTGGGGGSVINVTANATINNCLIENNVFTSTVNLNSGYGGTIRAEKCATITGNVIRNNSQSGSATIAQQGLGAGINIAGVADAGKTGLIANNVIYNNSGKNGTIHFVNANVSYNIINNTIVNNFSSSVSSSNVGGISNIPANAKIYNNVVYNNALTNNTTFKSFNAPASVAVDLQNNAYNGTTTAGSGGSFTSVNNNNALATPNFVDPSTTIGYTAVMPTDVRKANFALQASSTALVNLGGAFSGVTPSNDINGYSRPNGVPDIGAYEYFTPTITLSTTALTGFTYSEGSGPSSQQSFTVSGLNVSAITVTPPTNYEISTISGSGFQSSAITIPRTVATITIYVRLKAGLAANSYNSENVVVAANDVTTQNVACSGTVTSTSSILDEPSLQASAVTFSDQNAAGTGFTINWTAGNGANHIVMVKATSAVDANPVDATSYTANTVFGSGTQIGTGNYVVFSGIGSSVSITGLTKGTNYYVSVFTYNGSAGTENYLTSNAVSGYQLAAATITSNGTGGGTWATAESWNGGVVPGQYDNVTILNGDIINVAATAKCNNLTINSGAKVWATGATNVAVQIYGTSLVCDGIFGDELEANSKLDIKVAGNLTLTGSSTSIYPNRIYTYGANNSITINANTSVRNSGTSLLTEYGGGTDFTYNISSGKILTLVGALSPSTNQSTAGASNSTINVYGTLNVGNNINATTANGKTFAINVIGGTLNTTGTIKFTPSYAVQAPTITVSSPGVITAGGIDCSNTIVSGAITGTGTFTLTSSNVSGASLLLSNADGLDPVTGPIRTSTRNFNTDANYSYVGSVAQATGSELPSTVNNLTINNAAGVTLGKNITVNGTLSLTAGTLTNGSYNVSLENAGTINSTAGTMTVAPVLGSAINLTYNGATPVTLASDFLGSATVSTLTVNNTAGVTLSSDLTNVTNLTIGTNGILNVNPGKQLTIGSTLTNNGSLNLLSDANGTATLVDSYNTPTINATVKQYVTAGRNWYMSAPLNNTADYSVLDKGASVAEYNETTGLWPAVTTGTLTRGKGYVQVASAAQGTTGTVSFRGTTNSGDVPVTLTYTSDKGKGFNLVGNPYPSYLSWSALAADNAAANMPTGTMWYRTISYNGKSAWAPNTAYSLNEIVYNGTRFYKVTTAGTSAASGGPTGGTTGISDGSVVWNYEGSVYVFATISASGVASPATVSNLVPPMQAFWVKSTGGTLTFKNAMRSHNTGGTNALKAPRNVSNDIKLLRLNVSNGVSADEAVIYNSADASNEFDTYDAPKYFNLAGSNQPEIYTQAGNEKLVINAMNELSQGTEIPLGFATEKGNDFTISASEFRNFGSDIQIFLKDKQKNTEFNLSSGQMYAFSSEVVNDTNRFSIIFRTSGVATGVDNAIKLNAQVFVNANNQITIIAPEKVTYSIYNTVGILLENGVVNSKLETINTKLTSGVYFVVLTVNGQREIQKVIIR